MRQTLTVVFVLSLVSPLSAESFAKANFKPEFRLFLRETCVVSPLPKEVADQQRTAMTAVLGPLAAIFVPKIIEAAISGIGTLLKKAGADETVQASASEFTHFYETDGDQRLAINPKLGCLIGVYGTFADGGGGSPVTTDEAVQKLGAANIIPKNADILIVLEAAVIPASDNTAMYLDVRHFSVRDFIGDRKKADRAYVATLAITAPNAAPEGETIALGNIDLRRMQRGTLTVGVPGGFPRFHSNLMPWKQISEASLAAYTSDVKRDGAGNRHYMPVALTMTLSETAEGNKFLVRLGELLESTKGAVATELAKQILPAERKKTAAEEELSAEKLYAAEEDGRIAVIKAEAALKAGSPEQKPLLEAELDKAKRALGRASRLRKAAGLPDLPRP